MFSGFLGERSVTVADLIDSAILNFNHFSADGLDHFPVPRAGTMEK
jgi:hypothetical protein